jgi:hypothetical protein
VVLTIVIAFAVGMAEHTATGLLLAVMHLLTGAAFANTASGARR